MVRRADARARWLRALRGCAWRALLLLALLVPLRARAQTPEAEAQAAFQLGVEETRAGRWQEARAAFLRSVAWAERPSALYNLALAELKLGLGREALEHLDAFERVAKPGERPELWQRVERLCQRAALLERERPVPASGTEPILVEGLEAAQQEDLAAGVRAYARGQDALALEAFEATYHDSGRSELLFNVGLAADRLRSDQRALLAYEEFVAKLPELPQVTHARARIALLRAGLSERTPALARPARIVSGTAPPQIALRDERPLRAQRALLVSGALAGAGAVAAGFWWRGRAGAIHECDQSPLCDNGGELARQRRGAVVTTLALGTLALGLVTSGALWLVRGKRTRAARATPARAALKPGLVLDF